MQDDEINFVAQRQNTKLYIRVIQEICSKKTAKQEYEIVTVFKTFVCSDSPEAFKYYRFVNAENEAEFDAFLERCKVLRL